MKITLGTAAQKYTPVLFDEKKTVRVDRELKIGVEKFSAINERKFPRLMRQVVRVAQSQRLTHLVMAWETLKKFPGTKDLSAAELAERVAVELYLANYNFTTYKTKPKDGWPEVAEVRVSDVPKRDERAVQQGFKRGAVVAAEINAARTLANIPGADMPPKALTAAARKAAKGLKNVRVKALGRTEMKKLGMGGVLGVGQGSSHEPQLIILEYQGGKKGEKPVALVGKGITYDTGGLGLKPAEAMTGMHMDMTGGAMVIHALTLAARLGVKKNMVAIVAAAENAVGPNSYRMGDVLKTMSGKTIEVRHTDAEGRVVLADALTYAQKKYTPRLIVDVATLTGAAMVAVGLSASVALSRDEDLAWRVHKLGNAVGDYAWPLPLWDEYRSEIESKVADISNIGKSRWGGTINGGMFLGEFVDKKQPWVHIDIAPRMEAIEADKLADGAPGEPIRLLLKLTEDYRG